MKKIVFLSMILGGALLSCAEESQIPTKAQAVLNPTEGNEVHGTVTFMATDKGVLVAVDVDGLTPGKHGFHIHEKGDCNSPDGSAAGGHFNPHSMEHGSPEDATRHDGDMGNIIADVKGHAHLEYIDPKISLVGEHTVIGRSVIVHAGEDDFKTQPTGNAGARVACGVIEAME